MNTKTTRELISEAKVIINTHSYKEAKIKCAPIREEVNKRLQELSTKTNKTLGTHRSAPQIKVITDFFRFK